MPNFVEFPRDESRGSREGPRFTLQARGLLSFNQAAFVALGEPTAVALLYDPDEHIIALRKVEPSHANSYSVRKQRQAQTYVVGAQAFTAHYGIPTPRARRFAGVDYHDNIWGFALDTGLDVTNLRGSAEPPPAQTSLWRHTTDGAEVPSLMRITHKSFSHPGYMRSAGAGEKAPSMRIGTLIASDPLGPTLSTSMLAARFLTFLTRQPVLDLVSMMTTINPGATWQRLASPGRLMLEAAMMTDGQEEAPVASAMLLLPEPKMSHFGSDPRCAEFILHIEPRDSAGRLTPPLALNLWLDRFARALAIPGELAQFLTADLGLATAAEPPAKFGIWLDAPRSIGDLVHFADIRQLPGSALSNQFIAYAIADPNGKSAKNIAEDIITQLCDFTLHLDNWESPVLGRSTRN
jgi:hypothetical protein